MKTTLTRWNVIDAAGRVLATYGAPAIADQAAAKLAGAKVETTEERVESHKTPSENDPFADLLK
ncbi:MAG TPA: hypothetical protein VGE52_07230 [Pirellulales bacterium]